MNDKIEEVINLTFELGGLLIMKRERGSSMPAEQNEILLEKSRKITNIIQDLINPSSQYIEDIKVVDENYPQEDAISESTTINQDSASCTVENEAIVDEIHNDSENLIKNTEPQAPKSLKMALNDKFLFRRELFGGNDDAFNETLQIVSDMNNIDEIRDYLVNDLCFDSESPTMKRFIEVITQNS